MSKLSDDPEKRARSLANLKPMDGSDLDEIRRRQLKGVETKKRKKEMLEMMKLAAQDVEEVGAITVMRGMVAQYLDNQDFEGASKLLAQIAEYEQPKLQRQEINQVTQVKELTDEELEAELRKLEG